MGTICDVFTREHRRLRAQLEEMAGAPSTSGTVAAMTAFARRLRVHMRIEEEVLFPAVAREIGGADATVPGALEREHTAFRELLAELEAAAAVPESGAVFGNLREFGAAFALHEAKEERVVYPLLDSVLSASTIVEMASILAA